ncbi:uncharacterized protein [Panulirus ornatus]|uniref:uncharacterized protein n=1 Tax=Panulirus ornatus TaxID=150431 RepID=UPI003A86BCB8
MAWSGSYFVLRALSVNFCDHASPNVQFCDHASPNVQFCDHASPNVQFCDHASPNVQFCDHASPNDQFCDHASPTAGGGAVEALLDAVSYPRCSVILLTAGYTSSITNFKMALLRAPGGVVVYEAATEGQDGNVTNVQVSQDVEELLRVRRFVWCVTVVVMSDNPAFLASFTKWAFQGGLMVRSAKLLVVTRLPLPELQHLQGSLSMMNAMILTVDDTTESERCGIFMYLPYGAGGSRPLHVASWTPQQGLTLTTHLLLFHDKFSKSIPTDDVSSTVQTHYRLAGRPSLTVTTEVLPTQEAVMVDDPEAPGGRRLTFTGPIANVVDYLAKRMNFTYMYVRSPEKEWGIKKADGSWTGMVGLVSRQEVDIALGLFSMKADRTEVMDFIWPLWITSTMILGSRGRPEVDPWGFLMPLTPLVWAAVLTVLLMILALQCAVYSALFSQKAERHRRVMEPFSFIRVLLQQDIMSPSDWRWERMLLALWMVMTLVLIRSYAGTLMSLLAVRYLAQPFQSLQDVLDDSSVVMIWNENSGSVQSMKGYGDSRGRPVRALDLGIRSKFLDVSSDP